MYWSSETVMEGTLHGHETDNNIRFDVLLPFSFSYVGSQAAKNK